MGRRGGKSEGKLVVAALVAAPFIWLFQKLGTEGIVLIVAGIVILLVVNSVRKKKKPARNPETRRNQHTIAIPANRVDDILEKLDRMDSADHLGRAAESGRKAKSSLDAGDLDGAWKHYHNQKAHYLKHSNRSEFTPTQTIALDASVNRSLANVLRIQGKHTLALTHVLYYYATTPRRTQTDHKQILAYYNRAKIKSVSFEQVRDYAEKQASKPDFRSIQAACSKWVEEG